MLQGILWDEYPNARLTARLFFTVFNNCGKFDLKKFAQRNGVGRVSQAVVINVLVSEGLVVSKEDLTWTPAFLEKLDRE